MSGSIDSPDSDESDDQTEEDKELLKRLRQGQARMEQVQFYRLHSKKTENGTLIIVLGKRSYFQFGSLSNIIAV